MMQQSSILVSKHYGLSLLLYLALMTITSASIADTSKKSIDTSPKANAVKPAPLRSAKEEMSEHMDDLRVLMVRLYQANPDLLQKSSRVTPEEFAAWAFEGPFGWKFDAIQQVQGLDALALAFQEDYQRDRVLPLITGLQTMLVAAYGGETEYRFTKAAEPQQLHNCARNIELVGRKLAHARDDSGKLYFSLGDVQSQAEIRQTLSGIIKRTLSYAEQVAANSGKSMSHPAIDQQNFIPLN